MKLFICVLAAALLASIADPAGAQEEARSLTELLRLIEQGQARDSKEAQERQRRFEGQRNEQQNLLDQARNERTAQERASEQLEQTFEENQQAIMTARQALDERLGSLKELFGVLQTVSGDLQGRFDNSLTSLQFPDRGVFLTQLGSKMASASELASIEDIEKLWYELQREIKESGEVVRFRHEVVGNTGEQATMDVVRVGLFNVVTADGYLQVKSDGTLAELVKQPNGRYVATTGDLMSAEPGEGPVEFGIDVTRGGILGLLVQSKTFNEQIEDGGIVGYVTMILGAIGLLIAIWRWVVLSQANAKVSAQLKRDTVSTDNPLGRVLATYESNRDADTETLELKLSEAALREMPALTKGLLFIKVVSVVAPLLGLLGTVTGMIQTFQVITLYGAGDPKLMAGGISQALVTTVQGLVVAIPMVLLHTILTGLSKRIINVLQSQSAGLVAERSEARQSGTVH
jgi:biopolymer transport protein ExbB